MLAAVTTFLAFVHAEPSNLQHRLQQGGFESDAVMGEEQYDLGHARRRPPAGNTFPGSPQSSSNGQWILGPSMWGAAAPDAQMGANGPAGDDAQMGFLVVDPNKPPPRKWDGRTFQVHSNGQKWRNIPGPPPSSPWSFGQGLGAAAPGDDTQVGQFDWTSWRSQRNFKKFWGKIFGAAPADKLEEDLQLGINAQMGAGDDAQMGQFDFNKIWDMLNIFGNAGPEEKEVILGEIQKEAEAQGVEVVGRFCVSFAGVNFCV